MHSNADTAREHQASEWRLRPHECVVTRDRTVTAYNPISLPQGSLAALCTRSSDWECTLEIDYFHARIDIESLPEILGRICTTIGGSKVYVRRDFPVTYNHDGIAKECPHLDVINQSPFRVQLYLRQTDDVVCARTMMTHFFEKHRLHSFKSKPVDANLCEGRVMIPTRLLVQALQEVRHVFPGSQLFLNQYGQKHSWLHFQEDFRDVFVPDRHNLWDVTLNMRHKDGHIIMFRRNGYAGIVVILLSPITQPPHTNLLHQTMSRCPQHVEPICECIRVLALSRIMQSVHLKSSG